MDVYSLSDYRDLLRQHLATRQAESPGMSLRAYARDIGLTASRLSEVLSCKHGLSCKSAAVVAKHLQLNPAETTHFLDLVESLDGRSAAGRDAARQRIKNRGVGRPEVRFRDDVFNLISDWYHLAILELSGTKDFCSEPELIAKTLGITVHQVEMAIQRLRRLSLIKHIDGKIVPVRTSTATSDDIPSEAVRHFQSQVLQKARQALFSQEVERREIASMIMSIRRETLPAAKV